MNISNKKDVISRHQTRNMTSLELLVAGRNRIIGKFQMQKAALGRDRIIDHFRIEEKAI